MGRELRRKEAKKKGKVIIETKKEENPFSEVYKLLKTLGIIVAIIIFIYLLVAIVITKEIDWFAPKENVVDNNTVVDKAILAKNTFNQKEEIYYVYYYDFEEPDDNINSMLSTYITDSTVYKVNIKDAFNNKYMSESSNKSASKIDELKINGVTLIKLENDKITLYLESEKEIREYFNK